MGATLTHKARRGAHLVAAGTADAARAAGRLARQVVRLVRALRGWPAVGAVWWLLRLVGVSTATATAVVVGTCLAGAAVAWWALVVEPWLFAPRPSTRPRVISGPVRRPRPVAQVDDIQVDHVAFARALSVVADRYLEECQTSASPDDRGDW